VNEEMAHTGKQEPAAAPGVPGTLVRKVSAGVSDPDSAGDLRVALWVEGGAPSERYEFSFEAAGSGEASARMRNEATGREAKARRIELERSDFSDLLRTLDVRNLIRLADRPQRIPPDSVIARLEVSDGEQRVSTVFMADPEQAKDAGYEVPRAVAETVDRIFDLAARELDEKDVRP
jgi:hypothetical protein